MPRGIRFGDYHDRRRADPAGQGRIGTDDVPHHAVPGRRARGAEPVDPSARHDASGRVGLAADAVATPRRPATPLALGGRRRRRPRDRPRPLCHGPGPVDDCERHGDARHQRFLDARYRGEGPRRVLLSDPGRLVGRRQRGRPGRDRLPRRRHDDQLHRPVVLRLRRRMPVHLSVADVPSSDFYRVRVGNSSDGGVPSDADQVDGHADIRVDTF